MKAPEPVGGAGVRARSRNNNLPYHFLWRSLYSFTSRFLSNAEWYRSYDSRKFLSMRDENMSSPRGLAAGGMREMGRVVHSRLVNEGEGGWDGSTGRGIEERLWVPVEF